MVSDDTTDTHELKSGRDLIRNAEHVSRIKNCAEVSGKTSWVRRTRIKTAKTVTPGAPTAQRGEELMCVADPTKPTPAERQAAMAMLEKVGWAES